jgi:NADPH2:quinone reductase
MKRGTEMKALLLAEKGLWEEMKLHEVNKPAPEKGEVMVKVYAVGLNPVDYKLGQNGRTEWSYPHILGLDIAGIIEQVGEEVSGWQKGDRVVYHGDLTKKGGFAEYAMTTAHTISRIPESISFEEAAAIPCAGYTAYQALFRKMNIQSGQTILIHGGAGGVGGFAIQLAKQAGVKVITTASFPNHEYVKELGADHCIDYTKENLMQTVLDVTGGKGVQSVLDTVSGANATNSLEVLAFNGQLAYIAGAPDFSKGQSLGKALSFHAIALGAAHQSGNLEQETELSKMGDEMMRLLDQKKISSLLQKTIPLDDVSSGLYQLSGRHFKGKIVAKVAK